MSAFVSIMQGCNQHCTFCIVPSTRGEERSRTIPDIVAECRELVARGVKEITLLGQIVTSYGQARNRRRAMRHSSPSCNYWKPCRIEGLERIRFTSPHPKGYGDDLVEAYARLPKLCESAHMPVQSGSDRILKLMHRGYTRESIPDIVRKLRRPGPTSASPRTSLSVFRGRRRRISRKRCRSSAKWSSTTLTFSNTRPRRDTPAAELPEQLPQDLKEERHRRLLEAVNEIGARRYRSFTGQRVEILADGPSKKNPARLMGRTRCNKIVVFEGSARHQGEVFEVKIARAGAFTLYGEADALDGC